MAYKIRTVSRKEQLNKPDEFLSAFDRLSDAFYSHTRSVLFTAGGIVLIVVFIGAYFWHGASQEERAARLELEAMQAYQKDLPSEEGVDSGVTSGTEKFRTAIAKYQEVVAAYPGTRSAALSQYYIGNSYMELGEYDDAVGVFRTFLQTRSDPSPLRGLVQQRLAYALLKSGNRVEAYAVLEMIQKDETALNRDQGLFEMGRLLESENKKEEAILNYQQLVKEHPSSLLLPDARERLRGLGVRVPEPEITEVPETEANPETAAP